jgi:hypothetical protein
MSFWSILGRALGFVPAVTEAVKAIADAARSGKDKPRDIRRKHNWQYGLELPKHLAVCAYCGTEQTKLNVLDWCPAFEVRS